MGVLEDLQKKLSGTTEVVVNTPLPLGPSSLDKLRERLSGSRVVEAPSPITMPDLKKPMPFNPPVMGPGPMVGPPIPPPPQSKIPFEPALGYGAQEAFGAIANTVDDIRKSFTRENPMIDGIVKEWQAGGIPAVLNSVPQGILAGTTGLAGFMAGTAVWAAGTVSYVAQGMSVLDAAHQARADGEEVTNYLTFQTDSPMAQAMVATAAAPFSANLALLEAGAREITSDERVVSAIMLLGNAALLYGGDKGIKYVEGLREKRMDIKALTKIAQDAVEGKSGKFAIAAAGRAIEESVPAGVRQGEPFVFDNGLVLKTDSQGRPVHSGRAPLGKDTLDAMNRGKIPLPDDLQQPPGTRVVAESKTGAQKMVESPLSAEDRVRNLMLMVPHMKPETNADGYVTVMAPGHPFASQSGRVPLSRLVWEVQHSKTLAPWEEVHHANTVRNDNVPGNLQRMTTREAHVDAQAGRPTTPERATYPLEMIEPPKPKSTMAEAEILQKKAELDAMVREADELLGGGIGKNWEDFNSRANVEQPYVKRGRKSEERPVLEPGEVDMATEGEIPPLKGKRSKSYIDALARMEAKPGEPVAPKEYWMEKAQAPFSTRRATPDEIPGPGEYLRSSDGVVKMGEGVAPRMLSDREWPAVKEPPPGTPDYPQDLLLHEDFKAREQETVSESMKSYEENDGSTVNPYEGDMGGKPFWALSLWTERQFKKPGKTLTEADLYEFYRKNADLLSSDPRLNVGTWFNKKDGHTYVDVSVMIPLADQAKAAELGNKYNQKAMTNLETFEDFMLSGTGEVLKDAGWLPDGERMAELGKTGEMLDIYHYGNAPDVNPQMMSEGKFFRDGNLVTPQGMGRGQIGVEANQFITVRGGKKRLSYGNRLKSNFYTKDSPTIEADRWGGHPIGKGQVDKGHLFDASKAGPGPIDRQAVLAGKTGWYDPKTGEVRMLTPTKVERLGLADFTGADLYAGVHGRDIERYIKKDNPNPMAQPGDPVEDYSKAPNLEKFDKQKGSIPLSGKEIHDTASTLNFHLFDKFAPVHKIFNLLSKVGVPVDVMSNPSTLVRLLGGLVGKAEAKIMYKDFMMTPDGKVDWIGMALRDIYKPHHGDMPGFDGYLEARRVREVANNNLSRKPEDRVDLSSYDMAKVEKTYQDGKAKYEDSAKEFTSFFHRRLDELADSGVIERDVVDKWKAESPEYAPLRVDMEKLADALDNASGTHSARETLDRVASPIKKLRGSKEAKLPPSQAAVLMTYEITSAVERNRAARAIVDMRDMPGGEEFIKEVPPPVEMVKPLGSDQRVAIRGRKQDPNVVSVLIDGKRKYFEVEPELAESMKMLYETGLSPLVKSLSIPSRLLRTGATSAPEFMLRNPPRDWVNAFANAKYGFNPITDFSRALFDLVFSRKSLPESPLSDTRLQSRIRSGQEEYWKWKASGGEWAMVATMDKALGSETIKQMRADDVTGVKSLRKYIKTPLGYLEKVSELGEKPTRLGVFEKARMKGASDVEAAVQSRMASTDFNIRGAKTKSLASLYTFLNARAQTTLQLARSAKEHPLKFAAKGLAATAIPSIALYAINRDDPDYWKRDKVERAMFWFLPIEIGGRQVKIPKGEMGVIFGTSIETILEALDSTPEGRRSVTELIGNVIQSMSPVGNPGELLPTFARPAAEWINNKSYFYNTPIESDSDQGVAPYLRYGPRTSETAKAAGKATGLSPKMLENTLRGYTGGLGRHSLKAVDWAADKLGLVDKGETASDPMNIPGLAGFVSRRAQGFESQPAKSFYELADKLDMTKGTLKALLKQGPDKAQEIKQWMDDHKTELKFMEMKITDPSTKKPISMATRVDQVRKELADLRKMQNVVAENKDASSELKRKTLDALDKQISSLVDPLWRLLNAVSSQEKESKK